MLVEPYGHIVIGFCVVILIISILFAIYTYMRRKRLFKSNSRKYAIVDQKSSTCLKTRLNQIQPPNNADGKSHRTPNRIYCREQKKMIRYSDMTDDNEGESDDDNTFFLGGNLKDEFVGSKFLSPQTGRKSVHNVAIDNRRNDWKRLSVRLRRIDSSIANETKLGQIKFILYYAKSEEFLTVNLLSGRQIHASDSQYTVKLPVVSIELNGYPDTAVTSVSDEAPNPEYDQEFTFDGISQDKLVKSELRFTVWDMISLQGNETRIVGFILVKLQSHQKTLVEKGESPTICQEILPYLAFTDAEDFAGEVLISLMYDCVTDRIVTTIRQIKGVFVNSDDVDIYVKLSLLLDNDVIQTKRSTSYTPAPIITINESFAFSALSADLELLSHTTEFSRKSLDLKDKEMEIKSSSSETMRQNMGVLCSVRATSTSKVKRTIGTSHVGHTTNTISDEQFHWEEMVRQFDSIITHWHVLKFPV